MISFLSSLFHLSPSYPLFLPKIKTNQSLTTPSKALTLQHLKMIVKQKRNKTLIETKMFYFARFETKQQKGLFVYFFAQPVYLFACLFIFVCHSFIFLYLVTENHLSSPLFKTLRTTQNLGIKPLNTVLLLSVCLLFLLLLLLPFSHSLFKHTIIHTLNTMSSNTTKSSSDNKRKSRSSNDSAAAITQQKKKKKKSKKNTSTPSVPTELQLQLKSLIAQCDAFEVDLFRQYTVLSFYVSQLGGPSQFLRRGGCNRPLSITITLLSPLLFYFSSLVLSKFVFLPTLVFLSVFPFLPFCFLCFVSLRSRILSYSIICV